MGTSDMLVPSRYGIVCFVLLSKTLYLNTYYA